MFLERSVSATFCILLPLLLISCSGPGAPLLRREVTDNEGPLIAECKNVSSRSRVDEYSTKSYMSTWGSAFLEGATEGISTGFRDATDEMSVGRRIAWRAAARLLKSTDGLTFKPTPFCRAYAAQFHEVVHAVKEVLPLLENPITVSDEDEGYFETGFVERSHIAAYWRERYLLAIDSETPERTVLRIVRILYILRKQGGERYNQGVSVGHHEAWIMTRVADKLQQLEGQGPQLTTTPPVSQPPSPAVPLSPTKATISRVQVELKTRGFDPGPPDGSIGQKTREALRRFQNAHRLRGTGEIDTATLEALGIR
jgi:hypothetical protein